jgi:hypothetical protein
MMVHSDKVETETVRWNGSGGKGSIREVGCNEITTFSAKSDSETHSANEVLKGQFGKMIAMK